MGKINKVYYEEIDNEISNEEAGGFYFLFNSIGLNEKLDKEYIEYEEKQLQIRNKIINEAIKNKDVPDHPDMKTLVIAVSSFKQKPVLVVNY